jgi:hypothetical protein
MSLKSDVEMLRVEIKELQMLSIQNAKLTEELAIIIKGSETLGVEGIRVRQQKDDLFKQHISNRFEELKEEFDRKSEIIEGHLDDRLVLLQSKVDNLEDWKTTWTKAIDLITNSKTWKLAFIVGLGVAGLVIFIKFKALDIIDALQEYLNTK